MFVNVLLKGVGALWFGGWRDEPKADQKDVSQVRLTSFEVKISYFDGIQL